MILFQIMQFIRQWRRFNANLNELNRLSDRELADLRIDRSDIVRLAWKDSEA